MATPLFAPRPEGPPSQPDAVVAGLPVARSRARTMQLLLVLGAYPAVFALLFPVFGPGTAALAALPVMLVTYHRGGRMGIAAALAVNLVLHPGLLAYVGPAMPPAKVLLWSLPSALAMACLAFVLGRLRELSGRLAHELEERGRAEQALQERERSYAALVENAGDIIYRADVQGRFTYVNPVAARIMEYTEAELIGKRFLDLIRPDARDAALTFYAHQLRRGVESTYYEFPAVTGQGREVWFGQQVSLVYEGRRLTGVQAIVRDITARRHAEAELAAQQALLRSVIDADPSLVFVVDLDGRFRLLNKAMEHIVGCSAEEVAGLGQDGGPAERRELVAAHNRVDRQVLATMQPVRAEMPFMDPAGEVRWFDTVRVPIRLGDGTLNVLGIGVDVTERREAEAEVRRSRDRYRSVVEHVKDVVFQTDAEGRWTFLNPAWAEITGFGVDESLGRVCFDFVHPDDRRRNRELFEPLFARQTDYCRHEIRCLTKQGGFRWIEVFARLTLDETGEVVGTSGTLHDVTQQRQAMQTLAANLETERELGALKSRFVSMASHELRTPLTAIKSSAELLEQFGDRWDAERRRTLFARILSNVQAMTSLVEDVLLLGRAESGRLLFQPQAVDLRGVCEAFVAEFRQGGGTRHGIHTDFPDGPVEAEVDARLLQLILGNLLANAVKYAPAGTPVEVRLSSGDGYARLSVTDHGIGIPEADRSRLFEPFHRASNVEARPGTGLGLSIVKRAVDLHGGRLHVESTIGVGTTFEVVLPAVAHAPAAPSDPIPLPV